MDPSEGDGPNGGKLAVRAKAAWVEARRMILTPKTWSYIFGSPSLSVKTVMEAPSTPIG
jgi:hypothetical protein